MTGVPVLANEEETRQLARAAAGDHRAFAWLVQMHQGYLRKLLGRVCRGDQARADDLAQEAFVRAWKALPGFRGEARFRTWLTRIAYSALSAERAPPPSVDLDDADLTASHAISDFAPSTDWRLDLDRAMNSLNENERRAMLLCFGADLSHTEAAQVLGWPIGTLKTQVLRARAKLRHQLNAWEPKQ